LYGIATAEESSRSAMLLGGGLGVLGGVVVGYILYTGLLRLPLRWFFAATGVLVLMLAASMASQAARFLIQADLLPALGAPLWDSSGLISEQSVLGMLLHSLLGYDSHPAGMQVIFYVSVLLVGMAMRWIARSHAAARGAA
ncbi:MAG TPA: FTR1 family protein, partial [Gallionellaceae bacterium]|nr:FTR1 family protein [Gallionellaceae bacterium]